MKTDLRTLLDDLVLKALDRQAPTREQALDLLATSDDDLLEVVAAGGRVRRHFFGNRVKLNLAVSSGQRNEFGEFLSRHHITESLSWSPVETALNS